MKFFRKWMLAMAASFIVICLAACGNDSATTENGGTGGATAAPDNVSVSDGLAGTYVVDLDPVREQLEADIEAQASSSSEAEQQMAEDAVSIAEEFISFFEGWRLEIKEDNSFLISQSETEQIEGTWALDGDQMTLRPVRFMDGAGWKEAEGAAVEIMKLTWDSNTNSLTRDIGRGPIKQLIFERVE